MSTIRIPDVKDVFTPTFPEWEKMFWPSGNKEEIHKETPGLRFMPISNMPTKKGKAVCFAYDHDGRSNITTIDAVMFTEEEEWVWIQAKFT